MTSPVFFWHFAIFFSSGRGSFFVLSAPWRAGRPPGPRAHVWALAEVRGTCSGGSKWQVPSGRDSKHVEPSRCIQTQEQVKIMSDGSCDIWDLECHHCRQTVLGDGKVFPRHQHARHATTFSTIRLRIWPYYFFVPFCEMNQLQTNPQPTLLRPSFAKLDQFNF